MRHLARRLPHIPRLEAGGIYLLLLILSLGIMACSGERPAATTVSAAKSPTIELVSPTGSEDLPGDAIVVRVAINGFTVDPTAVGMGVVPGAGHWHLYLDGEFVTFGTTDTLTLENVPEGSHHLRTSLANNDHSPLTPPVEDSIVIDVAAGASSPVIGGSAADY